MSRRYLFVPEAAQHSACPALLRLNDALTKVGHALAAAIAAEPRLGFELLTRNDGLFACFPGKGAKYNCHYDGGGGDPRKLVRRPRCSP